MELKGHFPIFKNYPELIFLDNASTTQKPSRVIESICEFYSKHNANVHRGLYPLSERSTSMYEEARKTIAEFINAEPEEIIFTSGTTDGINSLVRSLINSKLVTDKPNVLVTEVEHHSNILPYQVEGSNMNYLKINNTNFTVDLDFELEGIDILSISHISNVTGAINDPVYMKKRFKPKFMVLDCAQSIAHASIDVKSLGVDFAVFSGHKMYGPTGIGVLYGKKDLLQKMQPFRVGGGMIREVNKDSSTWSELPEKFEAGTPSIADAIALGESAKFLNDIGFQRIEEHEQNLRRYAIEKLNEIKGISIFHPKLDVKAGGVISFYINGIHPHDLAQYLGDNNICLRAGHHCTQIFHKEVLNVPASLRLSFAVYNTEKDIDVMIEKLNEAISIFR